MPLPTITSFSGDKNRGKVGDNLVLTWNVSNADTVSIDGGVGDVALVGTATVALASEGQKVFTLKATNSDGEETEQVRVSVTGAGGFARRVAVAPRAASATPTPPVLPAPDAFPVFGGKAVNAEAEVGHTRWPKKRIRVYYHLLNTAGVAPADMERMIRKRTMKWVRRCYSQVNMSPKIVGVAGGGGYLPFPHSNMISIHSWKPGHALKPPLGTNAGGTASSVAITYSIDGGAPTPLNVPLTGHTTFAALAQAIADAFSAVLNLRARLAPVAQAERWFVPGHDIYVDHTTPGSKVEVLTITHDDRNLGRSTTPGGGDADRGVFEIPKLAGTGLMDDDDSTPGGAPFHRLLLRSVTSSDDRIDILVLPKGSLAGRAYPDYLGFPAEFKPEQKLRRAAYVCYEVEHTEYRGVALGEGGTLEWTSPYTLPHEIDHVLAETAHNEAEGDLMRGKWSLDCRADSNKRIYSGELLVGSQEFTAKAAEADADPFRTRQDMGDDMHTRNGRRSDPQITEAW